MTREYQNQPSRGVQRSTRAVAKPLGLKLYKKEIPAQVLSCKYCKIFKNTYFEKHLQTAAFDFWSWLL